MTSTTNRILRPLALASITTLLATGLLAQDSGKSADPAATATAAKAAEEATEASESFDSRATREKLDVILDRHPHEVGMMLKLDPSLLRNETWLAAYPALKEFVAQHPEITQNSAYYLERVHVPGDSAPEPAALRMTREMIEGVQVFVVMLTFFAAGTWLIRTLLEHRRWSRVSKVQTEIYNKLLDRFTSHEDLMRYVQSEAGTNFLQSAIAPISTGTVQQLAAPVGRILWSAQAGIVLVMIGVGLQLVAGRIHPDAAGAISTFGILALFAGLGFALSALVAWMVSRRLGILPQAPEAGETAAATPRTLGER